MIWISHWRQEVCGRGMWRFSVGRRRVEQVAAEVDGRDRRGEEVIDVAGEVGDVDVIDRETDGVGDE